MARTKLFKSLQRLANQAWQTRRATLAAATTETESSGNSTDGLTRRTWLQSAAALGLAAPVLAACGKNEVESPPVVIIGGGLAGLHCAYRLLLANVPVRLLESSDRTGGRTYSADNQMPSGQLIELGGELIDSGHLTMKALADEFGLTLDDLVAQTEGLLADTYYLDGSHIDKAAILNEFVAIADIMANAVAAAEADDAEFARVDAMSIPQWLEDEAGLPSTSHLRMLLEAAYLGEYGLEVEEQSIFNLLYLIDYETTDDFLIFGDSDERFHLHAGSEAIAKALRQRIDELDADCIQTGAAVTKVAPLAGDTGRYEVTAQTTSGTLTVVGAHVVFALPFTRLRQVDLSELALPAERQAIIDELGYGTNAKLMMQYAQRVWNIEHGASGSSFSDVGDLQTTWDTTRGQAGDAGIITNFVGGARGLAIGAGTAESRALEVQPWLDTVFPGTAAQYVADSAVRMHWPTHPHTLGSYACYRPGQWSFYGLEGERIGNLHFAGEHCSLDFQGYMEGAAETGLAVAVEILDQYNIDAAAKVLPAGKAAPTWAKVLARQVRRDATGQRLRRATRQHLIRQALGR